MMNSLQSTAPFRALGHSCENISHYTSSDMGNSLMPFIFIANQE